MIMAAKEINTGTHRQAERGKEGEEADRRKGRKRQEGLNPELYQRQTDRLMDQPINIAHTLI